MIYDTKKIIERFNDELFVSESDYHAWLTNPCTAIFRLGCIKMLNEAFYLHLKAAGMHEVCEYRGAIRATLELMAIPEKMQTSMDGVMTEDSAKQITEAIQEMLDEYRQRRNDE